MPLPASVIAKVERAYEHLRAVESAVVEWCENDHPAHVATDEDVAANGGHFMLLKTEDVPPRIALIAGDFLQNLRSSLDYLVWELVLAEKEIPDKDHMFPVCSTSENFAKAAAKRLRRVGQQAVEVIKSMQPYHAGENWRRTTLAILDELCNTNKHRRVLFTALQGGFVGSMETAMKDGIEYVTAMSNFDRPSTAFDLRVMRDAKADGRFAAYIAFQEGALKDWELGTTLARIFDCVYKLVLPPFERFFP